MSVHPSRKLCVGLVLFLGLAVGLTHALQGSADSTKNFELKADKGRFSLDARDARIADILAELQRLDVIKLTVDPNLKQRVSVNLQDVPLETLLGSVTAGQAFIYEKVGDTYQLTQASVTSEQAPIEKKEEAKGPTVAQMLGPDVLTNTRKPLKEMLGRNAKAILLQNAIIDTEAALAGKPVSVPPGLSASPKTEFYIVQFDHAVSPADKAALEAAGAKVSHYVPNAAYAVRVTPDSVAGLRSVAGVTYVEPYQPYYKLSKDAVTYVNGHASEQSKAAMEQGEYNVMTFRGATADADLKSAGIEIVKKQTVDGRDILTVKCKPELVQDIARIDPVQWVEPKSQVKPMNDLSKKRIHASSLKALHPTLNGDGVIINVNDTGVDFINPGFSIIQNLATSTNLNTRIAYYESRTGGFISDGLPGDNNGHGTHVSGAILGNGALSATVGSSPGSAGPPYATNQFAGVAPGAKLVMLEDFTSFSDSELTQIGYNHGARISNNSWGDSTYEYGTLSATWDALVRDADSGTANDQPYIAFFAAGNAGEGVDDGTGGTAGTVGQPGNAKNVITVGAIEQVRDADNLINVNLVTGGSNVVRTINSKNETDSDWQMAYFSSRGPVTPTDLRIKPDIVAPGSYVLSIQSHETPSVDDFQDALFEDFRYGNVNSGTNFAFFSGTSAATPIGAGGAALIFQYYTNTYSREPTPAMMKALMVAGARMVQSLRYHFPVLFDDPAVVDQGFGLLDVERSVDGPRIHVSDSVTALDESVTPDLTTGQIFQQQVTVGADEGGLKIVLAWTDAAGTPGNSVQLVNDLDLYVSAPGGGGYQGNRFESDGVHSYRFTQTDPAFADGFNNVETIVIRDAPSGTYTVQVRGHQVASAAQDFSLVIMKGIGTEGRTRGDHPAIALDTNDSPVIAYSDKSRANGDLTKAIYVKKWVGPYGDSSELGQWKRLDDQWFGIRLSDAGNGISAQFPDSVDPSICVDGTDIYVPWVQEGNPQDTNTHDRIFLRKYNGTDWVELGGSGHQPGINNAQPNFDASDPSIAMVSPGTPAVAWRQKVLTGAKVFVSLWGGSSWFGLAGSDTNGLPGGSVAVNPDIITDSGGIPVVAWEEQTTQKIPVYRWDAVSTWVNLGNMGNAPYAGEPDLARGPNNEIYLTWVQTPNGVGSNLYFQVFAAKYAGGIWTSLGNSTNYPGISFSTNNVTHPYHPQISLGFNGSVFVSWQAGSNVNSSILCRRFNGSSWVPVAGAGTPPGVADNGGVSARPEMVVDSKNIPIIAFDNDAVGESEVMTYTVVGDRSAPTFAGLQNAAGGTNSNVTLTWQPAVDDISTTILYRIFRSTTSVPCGSNITCSATNVFGNQIAVVTNITTFNVTGLTPGQTYCFGVRAQDTNDLIEGNQVMKSAGPVAGAGDNDADCLDNTRELLAGTEPCLKDTDGDGMWDGWEWTYSTNNPAQTNTLKIDPLDNGFDKVRTATPNDGNPNQLGDADPDGDGASNYEEFQWWLQNTFPGGCGAGSPTNRVSPDPTKFDTDGDGMPDGWEIINGLNPTSAADAITDLDGDGVNNLNEYLFGSDPNNADSDSDGLQDGTEIGLGTNPALADTDRDGLDDGQEVAIGSNPRNADSNGSSVSDGDVFQLGMNPTANVANLRILLNETFEGNSTTRTNWTHYAPNGAFPFDYWHLSTAEPSPKTNGISLLNDHTTSTAYRAANDATKTNVNATYNIGSALIMALQSPLITNAVTVSNLFVSWNEYFETEPNFDLVQVQARGGSSTNWINVSPSLSGQSGVTNAGQAGSTAQWTHNLADLTQFAGRSNVQVRFLFTVLNNVNNQYRGWWVDDVKIYEGTTIRGWVRDNNGRAVQNARVLAMGRGGVTNVVAGHRYVNPGKVFGDTITAVDGSYTLRGLPQGNYYVKASSPLFIDEFYDGSLFTGTYAFAAGQRPGVASRDAVSSNGVLNLTAAGAQTNVYFELEAGNGRANLAVLMPNAAGTQFTVTVDRVNAQVWNGLTNVSAAITNYLSLTNTSVVDNHPDWQTNAVRPTMLGDLAPGYHRPYAGANLLRLYGVPEVNTREGEVTVVAITTNQAGGRIFANANDNVSYAILIDGRSVTNRTPATIQVREGLHQVTLVSSNGQPRIAPKLVTVVIGARANAVWATNELAGTGAFTVSTVDVNGNAVTGASIWVDGSLVTTNDVIVGSLATTPTTVINLRPGSHDLSLTKTGYQQTDLRAANIVAGVSNAQVVIMYQSDRDYDRVGDATEVSGYTNVFLYTRDDDPDADGLNNQFEFDLFRLLNVAANPFQADTDADGMPDGAEINYDGTTNRYGLSRLYTNAVALGNNIKILFVGSYLAGIDNFGNGNAAVSIDGDRAYGVISHPALAVPTALPALTVITNIPSFPESSAIGAGHAPQATVYSDGRPDTQDTDADGMWDGYEYAYGLSTDAKLDVIEAGLTTADADFDGVDNLTEFLGVDGLANTNDWSSPILGDTDADGMPDGFEYSYGLDPTDASDAFGDLDGDGLVNLAEFYVGTSPLLPDTDADFLSDYDEVVTYGSNPMLIDSDNDGLLDGQEVKDRNMDGVVDGGFFPQWAGGDLDLDGATDGPTDWDTDGDGMPDGFEVMDSFGNIRPVALNPYDPTDADGDPDGDGLSNLQEYLVRDALYGTHPSTYTNFTQVWYGHINQGWTFASPPYAPNFPIWDYSSDPFSADSDGDGMPDGFEVENGLHPVDPIIVNGDVVVRYYPLSIEGDPDEDGLYNEREYTVRYALDGSLTTNSFDPNAKTTHPWHPDSDNDGLDDGEETRTAYFANPTQQDTDGDRLPDGAGSTNAMGEVESTVRHQYAVIPCPSCSWLDAFAQAQIQPNPADPTVFGQLATISDAREYERVMKVVGGVGTNIAIGEFCIGNNIFANIDGSYMVFANFGTNLPPIGGTNGVVVDLAGNYSVVNWTSPVVDHILVEWEGVPTVTNHFDEALNDLWQCNFFSDAGYGAPFWTRVAVSTNSSIPPARWGYAMTYVPGYEIKDQNAGHDPHLGVGSHILLDNRKLVVIGGGNGVEKYTDVWEYWIKSNAWTRSVQSLSSLVTFFSPDVNEGLSDLSACLLMGYSNTKDLDCGCGGFNWNCGGISFGEPKDRPWDNGYQDSSYDLTYILGGWNDAHAYVMNEPLDTIYYKSTDDLNPITEDSRAFDNGGTGKDVWQAFQGVTTVHTDASVTVSSGSRVYADLGMDPVGTGTGEGDEDGDTTPAPNFDVPVGNFVASSFALTNDDKSVSTIIATNVATGMRVLKFPFHAPCDDIQNGWLLFTVTRAPTSALQLFVRAEYNNRANNPDIRASPPYNDLFSAPPVSRLQGVGDYYASTNNVAFAINAGFTGETNINITPLLVEIASRTNWIGRAIGFVITNAPAETDNAIVDENSEHLVIANIPSYRVPATWHRGSRVQSEQPPQVPSKRKSFGMVYMYKSDKIVVFGGMDGRQIFDETYEGRPIFGEEDEDIPLGSVVTDNADVRKVRLVIWNKATPTAHPVARWGHSMVYDDVNDRVLMFGGFDKDNKPLNDLWEYSASVTSSQSTNEQGSNVTVAVTNAADWHLITDFQDGQRPRPRGGAAMVWYGGNFYKRGAGGRYSISGKREKLVLFGGTDGKDYFNDTWYYDEAEDNHDITTTNKSRWVLADPGGEHAQGPSPRAFAQMSFAQNGGLVPDPTGLGDFAIIDADTIRRGSSTVYLFGGRKGLMPSNPDTDGDLVDDGQEFELGGIGAGRDPRLNALVCSTSTVETVPFALKRIGTTPGKLPNPLRGAIANLEALSYHERLHGYRMGTVYTGIYLPWQGYPLETNHTNQYYVIGDETQFPVEDPNTNRIVYITGVDALTPDWTNLWYHRSAVGDPQGPNDEWELGAPNNASAGTTAVPPSAYSGRWCYGTDLDDTYPNNAIMELYSPIFDLKIPVSGSTSTNNHNSFFLVFREWVDLADANDTIAIDAVRPVTPADVVTRKSGLNRPTIPVVPPRNNTANTTGTWRRVIAPLDIVGNQSNLYLRFTLSSDSNKVAGGWYLDDIAILQGAQISGYITNAPNTKVVLLGTNFNNHIQASTLTDTNGYFQFGLLPLGQYNIGALGGTFGPFNVGDTNSTVNAGTNNATQIIISSIISSNPTAVTWPTAPGLQYRVEFTTNILSGTWYELSSLSASSTNATMLDFMTNPAKVYRVLLLNTFP